MLEKIREGSQGTIAKVILGAVILSFALAGIGSYLGRPATSLAAVVNGQEISAQALESAVQNERQRLQQQFGANYERLANNPAFAQQMRSSALERLVVEQLLDQAVAEAGLMVGDEQVRQAIREIPAFQVDGQFSNDMYLSLIQRQGYSAASFREVMRRDISRRQLMSGILESDFVLPGEVSQLQKLLSQTRSARFWQIDLNTWAETVTPTDEQLQSYYDTHQFAYQQPEMVSVEYVELSSKALQKSVEVTDADVEAYYEENKDLYRSEEERRASHILLNDDEAGRETAAQIQQQLATGADFGELAKKHSADTFSAEKGGDLDWVAKGVMGEAFDNAVFALAKEGEVSELVTSNFGLHLIKLTGIRPSEVKPLADVSAEIKESLLKNQALEIYYQKQEEVTNLAFEMPDSLVDLAQETGLTVQRTELFSRGSAPAVVANPKVLDAIFSDQVLRDGMNSDAIELAEGQLMVVRLKEHQQARTKSLDEVKEQVVQAVALELAREQAQVKADEMLATLNNGEELTVTEEQGITFSQEKNVARNNTTLAPAIRERLFAMPKPVAGSVYDKVDAGNSIAVIALDSVQHGEVVIPRDALKQSLEQQAMEQAYQELVKVLRAKAEIKYPVQEAK